MFSQPYCHPVAAMPQPRWGRGLLCALCAHLALVLLFYWPEPSPTPMLMPPAAIMMTWAAQFEAPSQPEPLPLGVQQQADMSAAQPTEQRREPEMPDLARAEAAKILVAERSEKARKQQRKAPPTPLAEEQEVAHSAAASSSAPEAQRLAQHAAAPRNSDSTAQTEAKLSWESRVKGLLNRVKRYPADAKRRQRIGAPVVSFIVDAQGRVSEVMLKTSSATASLDREALAVVLRAQPLPAPPAEMLQRGHVSVTMAVEFNLTAM